MKKFEVWIRLPSGRLARTAVDAEDSGNALELAQLQYGVDAVASKPQEISK